MIDIMRQAVVPEHSAAFMTAMSGGSVLRCGAYVFYHADDWLMGIGYPLDGVYTDEAFAIALGEAQAASGATACWAIGPAMPPELTPHIRERDEFYVLPADALVPPRLRGVVSRARAALRIEEGREFTAAHRRLWAEFTRRVALKPAVRELFARTEAVLRAPDADLRLLNAWDAEGRLAASLLLDYSPQAFCSYIIGAHSKEHYTPHAADALFAAMLEGARAAGKRYVHLGLGVNEGIRRFKRKWGGTVVQPYVLAEWGLEVSRGKARDRETREAVDTLMRSILNAPAMTKREFMASLPEQRPFAMLWELEKNGKISWIGGTAHFFCFSFERALRDLFEQVDTVILEGPLDVESLNEVDRIGKTPPPADEVPRIGSLLTEAEIRRLERVVRGPEGPWARAFNMVHPNPADVRELLCTTRHWCAFFSLWTAFLERRGWRQSVDLEAWNLAHDMGKTVFGMESIPEQIASLELAPPARIVRFLRNCDQWEQYMQRNVRAYLAGDLDNMMGTSTEFPSRTEQIIDHRDQRFRERMRPFIEAGRTAVFVGAAHMLNLRHMLVEDGFTVRQVQPTWKHRLKAWWRGNKR